MLSSMKCNFKRPNLKDAGPGFTLPVNIGGLDELDPAIRKLDLSMCNLTGKYYEDDEVNVDDQLV